MAWLGGLAIGCVGLASLDASVSLVRKATGRREQANSHASAAAARHASHATASLRGWRRRAEREVGTCDALLGSSDASVPPLSQRVQALRAAMREDAQKMAGLTDAVSSFIAAAWDAASKEQAALASKAESQAAADAAAYNVRAQAKRVRALRAARRMRREPSRQPWWCTCVGVGEALEHLCDAVPAYAGVHRLVRGQRAVPGQGVPG
jgi:hypothetical protein